MKSIMQWLTKPPVDGPRSVLLLRLMVGGVFFWEGLLKRLIAIPFVIEMIVAMLSTKISIYLGTSPLPLPPSPPQIGFWAVLHEIRSEYAQIMVALYLLINGPGKCSIDALLDKLRTA